MIQIKRGAATVATVNTLSSSNMTKAVMGDEQITLVWEAPAFVSYYLGDYITFEGANWTLNKLPTVKKLSSKTWQYNAVFQPTKYELIKAMYLLFTPSPEGEGAGGEVGEFPLTGTANTFMEMLVANLNRVAGSAVWTVGQVIENTDYKNLTFSNEDCLSVLARLASEFDTEYHVHNHIIHLKKISTEREITLQYGSTLYDIERSSVDSSDVVTRLYPFGSTKNLASNYRGGNSPLRLPVANGNYIENNVNLYGIIEQSKTFDDIYPRLSSGGAGVVTGVGNYLEFTDSALDFNINDYLLDGTKAKVHFNTGECAGYDFEIASYNHATKTFVLIPNTQENDFTLPTDDLKPAVGDKYVLIDIVMPPAYLAAAEAELLTRAQEYMSQNSTPKVAYKTTFSAIYAKLNLQNVECGDSVTVYDADMGINEQIRIVKLTKGLTDFWTVQFDLSNTVTATRLQRIEGNLAAVENNVIITNQRVNQNNLRAYQWTKELQGMVFDPDGYFDPQNIKPLSIETTMVSVSAKSQIFQLSSLLQPNYAGNPQVMQWSAGLLTHFTIADNAITEWIISQGSITITGENQTKPLYIYARCLRSGSTGDIYLAPVALKFNEGSTYYYFLIGVLHTPISAVRGISLNYGQSTINGQFITTGVISSIDGATYFNLNTGEIGGNIKFRSTSGALKTVEQAIDEVEVGGRNLILDSQLKVITDNTIIATNLIIGEQYVLSIKHSERVSGTGAMRMLVLGYTDESNYYALGHIPISSSLQVLKFTALNSSLGIYATEKWSGVNTNKIYFVKLEKGNKATDWSPAPEDTQKVLDDMSSDNKLTAQEKSVTLKEWQAIQGEYTRLSTLATQLGVSNTLSTPYTNLANYINPLLSSMTVTSDIVGSTFRSYFTAYYNASTDLQNALTSKVQANVTNLKPAGKNYLIGSRTDSLVGWGAYGGTMSVVTDAQYGKVVEYSRPAGGGDFMKVFSIDTSELKNTELVYYCIAKPISGTTVFSFGGWQETFAMLNNNSPYRNLGIDGWRMYYKVFTAGSAINSGGSFGLNSVGGTWRFHSFGVAKGNTPPADWDASPKEIDFLKQGYQASTDIEGGVVQTAVLLLRNALEQVTAGISGLAGDNVINWGAGTYQDAINDAAKAFGAAMVTSFLNKDDGGGHLAFGKIAWNNAGQLIVDGIIKAIGGKLGLFDILDGSIIGRDSTGIERINISNKSIATTPAGLASGYIVAYDYQDGAVFKGNFYDYGQGDSNTYAQGVLVTNSFHLPTGSNILFGSGFSLYPFSNQSAVINHKLTTNAKIYLNGSFIGTAVDNVPFYVNGAGTVIVEEWFYLSASIVEGASTGYEIGFAGTGIGFYQATTAKSAMGQNGLYSYWNANKYLYFSEQFGLSVRGATDIPAGLGGASINSLGTIGSHWGKMTIQGNGVSKNGNNYTITHYIGDTNYSLILTPISANVPYFTSKNPNTVVVTCAGGFDFVLIRTK